MAAEQNTDTETMDQRMGDFAEDLGRILGTAEQRATAWLSQRNTVVDQLTSIRDTASRLLEQLALAGSQVAAGVSRGRRRAHAAANGGFVSAARRGRPAGTSQRGAGRLPEATAAAAAARSPRGAGKGRVVSEETRRRMREAWARRKVARGQV